jgi:FMN phosphatase YigB (HAD superfamily)
MEIVKKGDTKKAESFVQLCERHNAEPRQSIAVGDQLDREIRAAKEAGLITVHFPGGFVIPGGPDQVRADHTIESFAELPGIVRSVREKTGA